MYPPCRAAGKRRLSSIYHYIKGYREKQFLSFPSAEGKRFRRSGGLPPQARQALPGRGIFAMTWRMHCRRLAAGARGGKGTVWFPCPLLTPPNPPLAATPFGRAAKRGKRGLGSGRRCACGQLLCPGFTLRDLPRMTVRGQTVQDGSVSLRKAPLRSRMIPWGTKRPCGPLAFRRATEGSRVPKEGKGSQEGTGNHTWCPVPSCSRR